RGSRAFVASPGWGLAARADTSGGGGQLMDETTASLKEEGLLDRATTFENVDQVLDGLERTAGQLATSFRFPPLDVAGLRREWQALKEAARGIPPQKLPSPDLLRQEWEQLRRGGGAQKRASFENLTLLAAPPPLAHPDKPL